MSTHISDGVFVSADIPYNKKTSESQHGIALTTGTTSATTLDGIRLDVMKKPPLSLSCEYSMVGLPYRTVDSS